MKKIAHSVLKLSVMILAAFIGGIIGPFLLEGEINLKVILGLTVFGLVVVGNVIYAVVKRKRKTRIQDE